MSFEKVCLTEANLPPVSSRKLMNKLKYHIVFFDENLQEIEILLQGKEDSFRYIPVGKLDDLFETISFHLSGTRNIDISLLAHGSREGIRIGRNFVNGDPTNVLLNTGLTGEVNNGLVNIITETDPLGKDETKSDNTDWWAVHGTSHSWKNWSPGDASSYSSFENYSQARASAFGRKLAGGISSNGFGIYGGANMPQEVFFTFFFTTPLNMKGLTSIDWMPWEEFSRTNLNINIEFRKAS